MHDQDQEGAPDERQRRLKDLRELRDLLDRRAASLRAVGEDAMAHQVERLRDDIINSIRLAEEV